MAAASTSTSPSLTSEQLAALIDRVKAAGTLSSAALRLGKLSAEGRAAATAALVAAGLELTDKGARVPLDTQLAARVAAAGERGVALAEATRGLKGARSPAEKKAAIDGALASGALALAIEGGKPVLLPVSDALLSQAELDRLPSLLEGLRQLVKETKGKPGKPRPTISRVRWLATVALDAAKQALVPEARPPGPQRPIETALRDALAIAPAPMGLVRVPEVVASLEPLHARQALVAALDALARAGAVELRPESGLARMSDEDRARCPIGFDGSPLSYARLTA